MNPPSSSSRLHLISGWAYPLDSLSELKRLLSRDVETCVHPFHIDASAISKDKPFILAGWSLGALQALHFLLSGALTPSALVLISGTGRFCSTDAYEHGMGATRLRSIMVGMRRNREATLGEFFSASSNRQSSPEELNCLIEHSMNDYTDKELADGLTILKLRDVRDSLAELRVPTVILHGSRDDIIPSGAGAYLQRHIPDAEMHILPEATHELPIRHPEWVAERIRQSLQYASDH